MQVNIQEVNIHINIFHMETLMYRVPETQRRKNPRKCCWKFVASLSSSPSALSSSLVKYVRSYGQTDGFLNGY